MEVDSMINILKKTMIGLGVAGTLAVAAATPSLARVVVVDPGYGYGYGYYADPYGGYAYAPGYGSRSWDNRAGYDIGGLTHHAIPRRLSRTAADRRHFALAA
jgi:hypothetical protein